MELEQPSLKEIFADFYGWKAEKDTWILRFMNGSQFLYLLEGSERALLIDTGYAVGGLREYVQTLTDKPIVVVNTHFHPDHAGGNGEWERVYLHHAWEKDAHSLESTVGDLDALPFPDYEKVPLREGDRIELGGRTIEVLEAKDCHSYSSLYLLDRGHRMFFMGDEMDPWQVMLYDNSNDPALAAAFDLNRALHNYRDNLLRAKALSGEYDWLFPNHNGTPLDKSYLDDFLGLVEHLYLGDATVENELHHKYVEMSPIAPTLCRVRYRKASAFVRREELKTLYGRPELL